MIEIERKFLVASMGFKTLATERTHLVQGFLNTHPERTVRIRIQNNRGVLTIKGKSSEDGTTRFELEKPLSLEEAQSLLTLCEPGIIEKIRYLVPVSAHVFEVDEFLGDNKGLVVAEIELTTADESFEKPNWLGKEVTGDIRYYNAQLSKKPYKSW